jgi:hypothetical protein
MTAEEEQQQRVVQVSGSLGSLLHRQLLACPA